MTIKEVAKEAAAMVGVNVDFTQTGDEQTTFEKCVTDTVARISDEFCDLKTTEEIDCDDGKIPYDAFTKKVKRIIKAVKNGKKIPFCEEPDCVKVKENGTLTITYAYHAEASSLSDKVPLPPVFSLNALAAGTAGEYCFRKGYYKEAEVFDGRFAKAIERFLRGVKSVTIKAVDE